MAMAADNLSNPRIYLRGQIALLRRDLGVYTRSGWWWIRPLVWVRPLFWYYIHRVVVANLLV